jgi:hypothetical protein
MKYVFVKNIFFKILLIIQQKNAIDAINLSIKINIDQKNSKKLTEAFIFIQTFPKQTKPFISHSTVATKNKKRRIRKKYVSVFYQHY